MLRFIHISDLHLGRTLHGHDLLELQGLSLKRISDYARAAKLDALVIAGDVFDRAVPAAGALTVFSDFIARMSDAEIPLIIIPGNHDSAERLAFLSPLMKKSGIFVIHEIDSGPVVIGNDDICVNFYALPYIFDEVQGGKTESAINAITERMDRSAVNILIAHLFTAGSITSESERFSGGSGGIVPAVFEPFDYCALGHLHRPQNVLAHVRYSGSILPYSVSEAAHQKSMTLVEIESKEKVEISELPLVCDRMITRLSGTFADFCDENFASEHTDDFVEATLTDETLVENPTEVIRGRFPWLLCVRQNPADINSDSNVEYEELSPEEVFCAFYESVSGSAPEENLLNTFLDDFAQVNQ